MGVLSLIAMCVVVMVIVWIAILYDIGRSWLKWQFDKGYGKGWDVGHAVGFSRGARRAEAEVYGRAKNLGLGEFIDDEFYFRTCKAIALGYITGLLPPKQAATNEGCDDKDQVCQYCERQDCQCGTDNASFSRSGL